MISITGFVLIVWGYSAGGDLDAAAVTFALWLHASLIGVRPF